MGPDGFEAGEGLGVVIDRVLKLRTRVAELRGAEKDRRDARIDHGGLEGAHPGNLEAIHELPRGEERALAVGGVEEIHGHLGGGEGHPVELKVPRFLHRAAAHGHLIEQGFLDVGLPNAHFAGALRGHSGGVDQPFGDGKGPHGGGQVAAVAGPVDEGRIDGDLAEKVVHVVARAIAFAHQHHLGGAGGGPTHAVRMLAVGVRAADDPKAQGVPGWAGHLGLGGQVGDVEEHALRGAPPHIGRANFLLRFKHAHPWASRKSSAKRWSTPPAS